LKFKLSTLFIINAAFALLGALGLLFMPDQLMASYGSTLTESGIFLSQIMGTILLGIAVISYLAKDIKDKIALNALLTGFIIAHAGGFIISLLAASSGVLNQMAAVDIFIHGVFAAGFGYFLFQTQKS